MKLTDYVIDRLATLYGVRDIFMISGGGAMHLVDSVGKETRLRYLCPHHEQAAAIMAEGYSRVTGRLAVLVVTSGPGGTNTLTGVIGQWLDSVPVLYLSGQVKQETTIESCRDLGLRQLGDQEINIVDIVRPVTKYAAMVKDPQNIRYQLDKAIYIATHGRPGPVWLDIPLDVQAALVDPESLAAYDSREDEIPFDRAALASQVERVAALLQKAERPLFVAGQGIRISRGIDLFRRVVDKIGIPVITSFCGYDLMPSDHSLFVGRPGTLGTRFGNFALQNADLLITVGSRNNIRQVSYTRGDFAKNAVKVMVDIDEAELKKPSFHPDIAICADASEFLTLLDEAAETRPLPRWNSWIDWCKERKRRYPVVLAEYWDDKKLVNPYCFTQALTESLSEGTTIVAGNGTACVALFQAGVVKDGQRSFWNSGCASMGYDLPAAIGACVAAEKTVVCLAGDGSLQMNIQELQTVSHNRFPVKLFVLNNGGYVSIRQTQDSFFEGRRVACGPDSGVTFPDIRRVALAYGIPSSVISGHEGMKEKIREVLSTPGPFVCEVLLSPEQNFSPRVSSKKEPDGRIVSKPLEDLYPFLPREELDGNMLVRPKKGDKE